MSKTFSRSTCQSKTLAQKWSKSYSEIKFRVGDYVVYDNRVREIVKGAEYSSKYNQLAYMLRDIESNIVYDIPSLFLHGKGEKLEIELMARILYQNLSPDQALDMHNLDKCPAELREILVRKMQEKLSRRK
jgi:hypothetical protein